MKEIVKYFIAHLLQQYNSKNKFSKKIYFWSIQIL